MTEQSTPIRLHTLTRRTVRAWWADGLWDFAVAGFCLLLAGWFHIFVRVSFFPSWTWPWPFLTDEVVNPLRDQFMLWMIGVIPLVAGYAYGAYRLVALLKARWLAKYQGDVRHPFWLKVEPRALVLYFFLYLGLFVLLAWLSLAVTGGAQFYSAAISAAFGAILTVIGATYALRRYLWAGALGVLISAAVSLLATTPADQQAGPRGLLDVHPSYGDPAIPLLIFAALFALTGAVGLAQVLRKEPYEPQ